MFVGTECYCGDSYGADGDADGNCVMLCRDDETESCGGIDYSVASVYQTTGKY